ncbi:hypothetical protein MSAN_01146900 [Mycena sanguinolenta]|uniref:Uncharacterized protein n=1 Tax=Mycena sanguinolenta TaxID=230812 RepID=A0A8H7D6Z0_9AGAR|nr:hypothetical protein MSAN_01146900 [Mycena sanguinolenta]
MRVLGVFSHPFVLVILPSPSTMAQSPYSNQDSDSIRASVYDVFLELGALDANSRLAEWIFSDPSYVVSNPEEVAPRETIKFVDGFEHGHSFRAVDEVNTELEAKSAASRPSSFARSFGLNFSPKRIGSRSSKTKSIISAPTSLSSGDGYETDEGYQSATSTPRKSRVRAAFRLSTTRPAPVPAESSNKPLPTLPPIRERITLTRTVSSVFRKRSKSPTAETEDDLQQWHEISALSPRIYNPSAENGSALVAPPPSTFLHVPAGPSSFRQVFGAPADTDNDTDNNENLTLALPRTLFRSMSLTKRRFTARARPRSLNLGSEPTSPRLATSLPSTPFVLVASGEANPTPGPQTPFVFISGIDNPTPLNSARRFSDVTSMTAPIYPLSIRALRRSMVFDQLEPSFPTLRHSSSCGSLQAALAASSESPYDIYNQPIPTIQRGKVAPFPSRPVLPQPLSATLAGESRKATIQRYREFSEQLVELTPYKRFAETT